jgi:hypothetical protein
MNLNTKYPCLLSFQGQQQKAKNKPLKIHDTWKSFSYAMIMGTSVVFLFLANFHILWRHTHTQKTKKRKKASAAAKQI